MVYLFEDKKVSFEHYCKHVIKQGLVDCFRVKGRQKEKSFTMSNPVYAQTRLIQIYALNNQ